MGIIRPFRAIPSAPNSLERAMEYINPKIPVMRFDRISKIEFFINASFSIIFLLFFKKTLYLLIIRY
jgi:hypothetical protein